MALQVQIIVSLCLFAGTKSTRIAFGSCNFPNMDTTIFRSIEQRHPDIFLWTGDATYLDAANFDPKSELDVCTFLVSEIHPTSKSQWPNTWNLTKSDPNYQMLLATCPHIIGVYDDHDYGKNGADHTFEHKEYAQQLFLDFLDIPQNDPKRSQQGIYDHYEMEVELAANNITKIIDIILLDTRYFSRQDGEENILGNVQWGWFEDIIANKTNGELTLIISGMQMMPVSKISAASENWRQYPHSQKRLFDVLINHNTNKRVLLISGDIHAAEMMKIKCFDDSGSFEQDFYEVTSSGLTHASYENEAYLFRQLKMFDDYLLFDGAYMCHYGGRNFGEINIEWDAVTNGIADITADIRDINGDGVCSLAVPLFTDHSDFNEYTVDKEEFYLWKHDNYKCYGGVKQHPMIDIKTAQINKFLIYGLMLMIPVAFACHCLIKSCCIGYKCCANFRK